MNGTFLKDVIIPEELCYYAQKLNYEMHGYKVLLMSVLRCGEFNYNKEIYSRFMTEYQKVTIQFNILMEELKSKYGHEFKDIAHDVEMYLLFSDNTLRFTQKNSDINSRNPSSH